MNPAFKNWQYLCRQGQPGGHDTRVMPCPNQIIQMFFYRQQYFTMRMNPIAGLNAQGQCMAEPVASAHFAKTHGFINMPHPG